MSGTRGLIIMTVGLVLLIAWLGTVYWSVLIKRLIVVMVDS